jgi:YidC/Oxa1 family membrane protein insertase
MKFDKNTVIGISLMILLVVGFMWYQVPSAEETRARLTQDSLAQVANLEKAKQAEMLANQQAQQAADPSQPMVADSAQLASKFGIFSGATSGTEKLVHVETDLLDMQFSSRGGMVKSVTLKQQFNFTDSSTIRLWDESLSKMFVLLDIAGKGIFPSDQFIFEASAESLDASQSAAQLKMTLRTADPSKYLEFVYNFTPGAYQVGVAMNAVNLSDELQLTSRQPEFYWQVAGYNNEKGLSQERQHSSVFYKREGEDREYLTETRDEGIVTDGKLQWMSFKQYFFSAAMYSDKGFGQKSEFHSLTPQDSVHNKQYIARFPLNLEGGAQATSQWNFYFGPNRHKQLSETGAEDFVQIIDYGWGIIGWLNRWFIRPVFEFFTSFIGVMWIIILLLTLTIKMLLFPVTWKNFVSSAKMRMLKPEMDELNKKFEGKDPVEKQKAVMSLYRQTGVNPFAGCVPVLFQMPILYAMFRFFPSNIELRGKDFLWADDLANYDVLFQLPWNIPFYGDHVSGLTILMCISTFFYSKMTMAATPTQQQPGMPNMKVIMNIFTFMMLFFFNSLSSGLTLYYFVANVTSIGQMWVIKKYIVDEQKLRDKIEDNKKKPVKKSSFQQRLEDMQKQQLAKQKALKGKK